MKILVLILAALFFFGCKGEKGDLGPTGPQGTVGAQGVSGSSEVKAFTFTLTQNDWSGYGNTFSHAHAISAITQDILDNGLVLVYKKAISSTGADYLYPWIETVQYDNYGHNFEFLFQVKLEKIILGITDTDVSNPGLPKACEGMFKVITIPGTVAVALAINNPKTAGYNTVKTALNLPN